MKQWIWMDSGGKLSIAFMSIAFMYHFPSSCHCGSGSYSILSLTSSLPQNMPLSRLSSSPQSIRYILFLYPCFFCLCFLLHLKCRNPSTAFYQAFQPSRLQGSKPFNNRYGLGCVNVCMCGLDWLAKPDCAPPITLRTLQKMPF